MASRAAKPTTCTTVCTTASEATRIVKKESKKANTGQEMDLVYSFMLIIILNSTNKIVVSPIIKATISEEMTTTEGRQKSAGETMAG